MLISILLVCSFSPLAATEASVSSVVYAAVRDECADCSKSGLCKPHLEHERKELERLLPGLESEDPRDRQEALRDIAEITREHSNAPSQAVAKVLVSALEDKRIVVRETAIELLVDGQHPEIAVKAMIELDSFRRNMWTLAETIAGSKGEAGTTSEVMRFLGTTMESAGELRDDRIVDALAKTLKAYPEEMRGQRIAMMAVESLLELGTQSAVKAVIKQFTSIKDSERAVVIQESLSLFASDHDIETYPEVSADWKRHWTTWLNKHQRAFPKKLGKWKGRPPESAR